MRLLNRIIQKTADSFGGLPFIVLYNLITGVWVVLGAYTKWFPDHYPYNNYTMIVSWLAINMSSLLLYVGKRQLEREKRHEDHKLETLNTLVTLVESQSATIPLIRQVANAQVQILEHLEKQDRNAHRSAVKQ